MKRTEDFYLDSECSFVEKCLNLLGITYERDSDAISPETGMRVYRLTFVATDEEYKAVCRMFKVSAMDLR